MISAVGLLLGGLVLLTQSADRLVLSATRLSRSWGVSPILIGALVVGLGTSAPELLISTLAAARGELDLAVGNVVGSNVSNVTLVFGAAALVTPITARLATLRREGAMMFVAVSALTVVLWDLQLNRVEGAVLVTAMPFAAWLLVRWSQRNPQRERESAQAIAAQPEAPVRSELLIGVVTLGLTLLGADVLVRGATSLADQVGISSAFVGLIIVSVGTSLPELATALAAARRGEPDLVVGNLLGSNIFNALMVAGVAALAGPGGVDVAFRNALRFMVVAAAVAGLFATTRGRLERWEGLVLLTLFVSFVAVAA
ncbi:MAG: calcium/sodium antiporter [Acidimicrobiia bacterium]